MTTVSIYNYLNYRDFLRDFYNAQKRVNTEFSYRYFLNKANIQSPIFYQQVILGKRNLTPSTQQKFIKALELDKQEAAYFKLLCEFNQAKKSKEKQDAYKKILKLGHFVKPEILGEDYYRFYKEWYNETVRELICMRTFESMSELAKAVKPSITAKQATDSVQLLLSLKMVAQDGNEFSLTDTMISTGHDVQSMTVRSHNKTMLELASISLEKDSKAIRNISGITMGLSKDGYDKITQEIEFLYQRIATIIDADKNQDTVYHLNTTLFPLSKTKTKGA